jgi:hypothetical protein
MRSGRIEEIPDAMPEELRVRLGWVTGRVDK